MNSEDLKLILLEPYQKKSRTIVTEEEKQTVRELIASLQRLAEEITVLQEELNRRVGSVQ